jgi:hypothetical protein
MLAAMAAYVSVSQTDAFVAFMLSNGACCGSRASTLAALTLLRRPLSARVAAFRRHRLPVAAAFVQAGQEAAD